MSGFGLPSFQRVSALLIALAIPFAFGSCQSIAGIDDRELGPCGHYCDVVMANCNGKNAQYGSRTKCLAMCQFYAVGDDVEWQGKNTLQCRLHEADLAPTEGEDQPLYCRAAGPEGFDCGTAASCSCGGGCNSYCTLYKQICGTAQCNGSQEDCVTACGGLRSTVDYDVNAIGGNTLQCRLVHLTNATVEPNGGHCGHAQLIAPTDVCVDGSSDGNEYGMGGANGEPDSTPSTSSGPHDIKIADPTCDEYCRVEMLACTGDNAQYENKDECIGVCNTIEEKGEFGAASENTVGCRIYHANNALCGPVAHCPHSGPGGEGVCGAAAGDKCDSYCTLAEKACGESFAVKYQKKGDCQADCATLPDAVPGGATAYTTTYAQTRGTLACRLLAASQAAATPSRCSDPDTGIFGKGVCAPE